MLYNNDQCVFIYLFLYLYIYMIVNSVRRSGCDIFAEVLLNNLPNNVLLVQAFGKD